MKTIPDTLSDLSAGGVPGVGGAWRNVMECAVEQAEAVANWLRSAMANAMAPLLATVPVVVDVQTAARWGE